MKNTMKLICMLIILVLSMVMVSGCSGAKSPDEVTLTMTIGIPAEFLSGDDAETWKECMRYWQEDYATFANTKISFTAVPTEEKAMKKFMRRVENGEISMFFAPRGEMIDKMVEKEIIISHDEIRVKYGGFNKDLSNGVQNISAEDNLLIYMMPLVGTYQGLFINSEIFAENEIAEPTDWASLLDAIAKLNEKKITPIAAGFADEGLEYMVDEMILSEGGTAEHSYQPTFGLMSSWERAVKSIKSLEKAGAFTKNCYNVSYADAKQAFVDGKAAMIVAPSADLVPAIDADQVKAIAFPCTPTGKREKGAILGDINFGLYLSAEYFNRSNMRCSDGVIELMDEEYVYNPDLIFSMSGEGSICGLTGFYDNNASSTLEESYGKLLSKATAADRPMRTSAYAMDSTVEAFRKALTGSNVSEVLLQATNAEIAAKKEATEGK